MLRVLTRRGQANGRPEAAVADKLVRGCGDQWDQATRYSDSRATRIFRRALFCI